MLSKYSLCKFIVVISYNNNKTQYCFNFQTISHIKMSVFLQNFVSALKYNTDSIYYYIYHSKIRYEHLYYVQHCPSTSHTCSHSVLSSGHKRCTIPMLALHMVRTRHGSVSHKSPHLVST